MAPEAERYFDLVSRFYDEDTSRPEDWYGPMHLRDVLGRDAKTYGKALAIGVGTGRDIEILKDFAIPSISMIDVSAKMLEIAIERYPSVQPYHADFMRHGFGGQRYDLIVCAGVLEFIEDLDGFVGRCAELLLPGGSVYLTYEPRIRNHQRQESATQVVGSQDDGPVAIEGVRVYRRDMSDFLRAVAAADLTVREYFEHVAYRQNGDVLYHFAVLDKR